MARLEAYRCDKCGNEVDEFFNDTEERPESLLDPCEKCGGEMRRYAFKNNPHRVRIQD